MADSRVRVDRGSIQGHFDDSRANMGQLRNANDGADRRQAHLEQMMEGGVGSDNQAQVRARTRHTGEEADISINRLNGRGSEQTDQFISNVRSAANKSIRSI